MAKTVEFAVGDVVQISDKAHRWYPCLLIVNKILEQGLLETYCLIGADDDTPVRSAYIPVEVDQCKRIGPAYRKHEEAVSAERGK